MTIVFLIFELLALLAYVITGFSIAYSGFSKARKVENVAAGNASEEILKTEWHKYEDNYYRNTPKPKATLTEYYEAKLYGSRHSDALRAQAYRRMLWCPVWPLLVVGDNFRKYRKAVEGEKIYLIENSTRELEKSMSYQASLDKAQEQAQAALEKAKK